MKFYCTQDVNHIENVEVSASQLFKNDPMEIEIRVINSQPEDESTSIFLNKKSTLKLIEHLQNLVKEM